MLTGITRIQILYVRSIFYRDNFSIYLFDSRPRRIFPRD